MMFPEETKNNGIDDQLPEIQEIPPEALPDTDTLLQRIYSVRKPINNVLSEQEKRSQEKRERNREQMERVREARYVALKIEDLERPGGLAEGYSKVLIQEDAMRCLNSGDIEGVIKATENGCFVFGVREQARTKSILESSVLDYLKLSLMQQAKPGEGQFFARALVDKDNKIISAGWWKQAIPVPKEQETSNSYDAFKVEMLRLLQNGVTGKMDYLAENRPFKSFHRRLNLPNTAFYDTLFSLEKFAAARLTLELQEEMRRVNPQLQNIILYILSSLSLIPAKKKAVVHFGANWASKNFFTMRRWHMFAHDFNKKGPFAVRNLDGIDRHLLPAWDWYVGDAAICNERSLSIWQQTQKDLGFEPQGPQGLASTQE